MLTLKQGFMLSAIADKLQIKITDPNADAGQLGADLLMQLLSKVHRAEQEILAFVAVYKGCTPEEAATLPLVDIIKEIGEETGIQRFLSSQAKPEDQESPNS